MSASGYKYTGILDEHLGIIYCDAPEVFHFMLGNAAKLYRKVSGLEVSDRAYHFFMYEGEMHQAKFERMRDKNFLCRISGVTPEMLSAEELSADLGTMNETLLSLVTMTQMIISYVRRTDFHDAEEMLIIQEERLADLSAQVYDMLFILSNKKEPRYIQLRKWLMHSADVMSIAVGSAMKRVSLNFNVPCYARIDYSAFELVLFNLAKLAFLCCCEGSTAGLCISGCGNDMLSVTLNVPFQQNCVLDRYSVEMRAVKHFFSLWGGRFDFCGQYGYLLGSGYVGAEFFDDTGKLDSSYDISLSGEIPAIMQRRREGAYRKLYFTPEREMFRSTGQAFDDIDDRELRFAKLFFSGINPDI